MVVPGKIVEREPSIGDIASPGRFTTSDSDKMATSVDGDMGAFPVTIFIILKRFTNKNTQWPVLFITISAMALPARQLPVLQGSLFRYIPSL